MYEHKIFTQGCIWGINSFGASSLSRYSCSADPVQTKWESNSARFVPPGLVCALLTTFSAQVLAKNILAQLDDPVKVVNHDSSTTGLIHFYQKKRPSHA